MAELNEEEEAIVFLTVKQVISLHEEGVLTYSPTESLRIRDEGLLESAVMMPQQGFGDQYQYPTIVDMASAYLVGLAQNHAFENGNKRVAYAACSTFLRLNGFRLELSQAEAVDLTMKVVRHECSREDVVELLSTAIGPVV